MYIKSILLLLIAIKSHAALIKSHETAVKELEILRKSTVSKSSSENLFRVLRILGRFPNIVNHPGVQSCEYELFEARLVLEKGTAPHALSEIRTILGHATDSSSHNKKLLSTWLTARENAEDIYIKRRNEYIYQILGADPASIAVSYAACTYEDIGNILERADISMETIRMQEEVIKKRERKCSGCIIN